MKYIMVYIVCGKDEGFQVAKKQRISFILKPLFQKYMNDQEIVKQKYLALKELQQQLEQLKEYKEILGRQRQELEISIKGIEELGSIEPETELLAPIASGIFVKAKLGDNTHFMVNVGSDITIEKTGRQVIELLQAQLRDIQEKEPQAHSIIQELEQQVKNNYQELEKEMKEDKT